jgi:hypothetical protein
MVDGQRTHKAERTPPGLDDPFGRGGGGASQAEDRKREHRMPLHLCPLLALEVATRRAPGRVRSALDAVAWSLSWSLSRKRPAGPPPPAHGPSIEHSLLPLYYSTSAPGLACAAPRYEANPNALAT